MSRITFFKSALTAIAGATLVLSLASCQPEQLDVPFVSGGDSSEELEYVQLPVVIGCEAGDEGATKATALNAAEGRASGAMVLVYRHGASPSTSLLDSYTYFTQAQIEAASPSNPLKVNVPVTTCDFYILGNLNGIHRTSGAAVNLMDALGADFPVLESDLEAMLYRLDGGAINGNYRREKMSEINTYGIPYQRIEKNVNVSNVLTTGIPNADKCIRLFSKVNLTISHAAFDGNGANPTYFTNKRLVVRQVNNRLQPFSTAPQKAAEAADVLAAAGESNEANFADYDLSMESYNASSVTVSLYVPENMQGNLLSNPASGSNNLNKIPANVAAGVRPYVTYVEYVGSIDKSAGGYGADVTYQFCLGADAYNNFDLERGKKYDVTLGFSVGNLFGEPAWKVNISGWSDSRTFRATADAGNSSTLPDGKMVAVRPNRPGTVYLFSSKDGGVTNVLKGKTFSDPGWAPSSLADCAITSDFMTATNAAADVPSRAWLLDRGITPAWDSTTGAVTFTVTDASRFNSHLGEERTLNFTLLPGDGSKTVSIKIRLVEAMSITWDNPLSGAYAGMARTATIKGYLGELSYCDEDGPHRLKHTKTGNVTEGRIDRVYANNPKTGNGTLTVYVYDACYPDYPFNFKFLPDDPFNDGGEVSFEAKLYNPSIVLSNNTYELEVSGKEEDFSFYLRKIDGSSVIPYSDLDPDVFRHIYTPVFSYTGAGGGTSYTNPNGSQFEDIYVPDSAGPSDVGLSIKSPVSYNSYGYPVYEIYRSRFGSQWSLRADKGTKVKNACVCFIPSMGLRPGAYTKRSSLTVTMLPFMSDKFEAQLPAELHDYTLMDVTKLDADYRNKVSTSMDAPLGKDVKFFCTEGLYFDVKPLNPDGISYTYTEGDPYALSMSHDSDGSALKVQFSDNGVNTVHTAGPHSFSARVVNKHSGESHSELLGETGVYVHIVCAGAYEGSGSSNYASISAYPVYMSELIRSSGKNTCSFADHCIDAGYMPEATIVMGNAPSISDINGHGLATGASSSVPYGNRTIASIMPEDWAGFGSNIMYEFDGYHPDGNGDSISVCGGISEGSFYFGSQYWCNWAFWNGSAESTSLNFKYKTLVDSSLQGYYIMEWLKPICSHSEGWKNVFEQLRESSPGSGIWVRPNGYYDL